MANLNINYYLNILSTDTNLYIPREYIVYLISFLFFLYAFRILTVFVFIGLNIFFLFYTIGPYSPYHYLSPLMCVTTLLIFTRPNQPNIWTIRTIEIYYSLFFFFAGVSKLTYTGIDWPLYVPDALLDAYVCYAPRYSADYVVHRLVYYTPYLPIIAGVYVLFTELFCSWFILSKRNHSSVRV